MRNKVLRNSRGHCGRCFTPWGCARPFDHEEPCGCHVQNEARCRSLKCRRAHLFVVAANEGDSLHLTLDDILREVAA